MNDSSATQTGHEPDTHYLNRELSELAYQERVLAEGLDPRNPPLERLRFLAFFIKNTDEFFMTRVGGLKQKVCRGTSEPAPDGRTPEQQWREVLDAARPLFERHANAWECELKGVLAHEGVVIRRWKALTSAQRTALRTHFESSILPTLTPLAFDPAHPVPFISNLSLSLAVLSGDPDGEVTFTRIKVPPNQSRLVPLPDEQAGFLKLEDLIEANLDLLLPDIHVLDVSRFRVTRNAEVTRDKEIVDDLVERTEEVLEERRLAMAVRLEVDATMPGRLLDILKKHLDVADQEVFHCKGALGFSDFFELCKLDRPDLKLAPWTGKPHPRLETTRGDMHHVATDIFAEIRKGDVLLHHPYHAFSATVRQFLDASASDPRVLAVKAAIYRTPSDSQVIRSLMDAASNGKQVAVMVELKARFDERNNLKWARRLEKEGIHVAYGTIGLKTHTKTALVVREEDDGVRIYSHIGTGNYHSGTAKAYSDLGLLTADRTIGEDLTDLFNFFTGPSLNKRFRKLLIAPVNMRERFTEMIRREAEHARAGRRARIVAKVNAIEDPGIIAELYRASAAGVTIQLIVRGICRLRPGVGKLSENITVHSIVGRFLEHARIYYFENAGDPEWFIGSADWMVRNLDNRVEAVTPVTSRELREQLRFILEATFTDNRRRWRMRDDSYERVPADSDEPVRDIQEILMKAATAAAERGYGPGLVVDTNLTCEELLVAPVGKMKANKKGDGGN